MLVIVRGAVCVFRKSRVIGIGICWINFESIASHGSISRRDLPAYALIVVDLDPNPVKVVISLIAIGIALNPNPEIVVA